MKYFAICSQSYMVLFIPMQEVMKVKSPLQLAYRQQMLATRAAGVAIAHHPPLARATTPIQAQTSLFYKRIRFMLLFYAYCTTYTVT
jgi:hypothetical protein